jgi:acetyl esterase
MLSQGAVAQYDPTARYDVRWRDIEYLHDGQQGWLARIYQPDGPGPFPLLVEIHGGAWTLMDRTQNGSCDEALASSGLVVAALDFHLGGQAPYPAAQADINNAIRWLKAHAANFNATAAGMGGLGFSSGGQQIMLAAMRPHDPRYTTIPLLAAPETDASLAYVIMAWPVIDPLARFYHARSRGRQDQVEAGLLYFGDEATMQAANPQQIVNRGEPADLPPALMVHGADDDVVPPTMAEDFVRAYARAGGLIELAKYPGERHRFMERAGPNTRRARETIKSFISRQLAALAAGD